MLHTKNCVVKVDELTPFPGNPRRGNVELIAESLTEHGQYRPLVVQASTMHVLAGNHTLAAARKLGWDDVVVTLVDVDDEQARKIVLVDNRTNDVAVYDEEGLARLLAEVPDLSGTGWDEASVDSLVFGVEQEAPEVPDGVDDVPKAAAIAKPGDVFQLGRHRVACGDSTEAATWEKLMPDGEQGFAMWTDPPYGVDYVGKTADALTIENDGADGLRALLDGAWGGVRAKLRDGAPCYVAHADTMRVEVEESLRAAGFLIRQNLVWVKNTMVLGRSDYHWQHEPILAVEHAPILYGFAGQREHGRMGRGGPWWYGGNDKTTVFHFDKPPAAREHPTMKPVELILAMMANSVRPGWVVVDPFGGSGSTLLACELYGADARLVELDPRFVDVICGRWQKLTGELPTRDGVAVSFLR